MYTLKVQNIQFKSNLGFNLFFQGKKGDRKREITVY